MKATVQRWGNSLALRIPAIVAREISVREGDAVELSVKRDAIVIRAAKPSYRLDDLLKGVTAKNRHAETGWNSPVGNEVW